MKLRLAQLDQSGATSGQVPVWDNTGGLWAPGTVSGGSGSGWAIDTAPGTPGSIDYEFGATTTSLPSGWSWYNQGSCTYKEDGGYLRLTCPSQGYQLHAITRAVPAGTSWTVTAKIKVLGGGGSVMQGGLILKASAGTNAVTWGKRGPLAHMSLGRHSNVSSFTSELGFSNDCFGEETWLRIVKNSATSYDFLVSDDGGTVWNTVVAAHNVSTYFSVDLIGILVDPENTAPGSTVCYWIRSV